MQVLAHSPTLLLQLWSLLETSVLMSIANPKQVLQSPDQHPLDHHHFQAGWPNLQHLRLFAWGLFWLLGLSLWPAGGQDLPSTNPVISDQ